MITRSNAAQVLLDNWAAIKHVILSLVPIEKQYYDIAVVRYGTSVELFTPSPIALTVRSGVSRVVLRINQNSMYINVTAQWQDRGNLITSSVIPAKEMTNENEVSARLDIFKAELEKIVKGI